MPAPSLCSLVRSAITQHDGRALGHCFNPTSGDLASTFAYSSNHSMIAEKTLNDLNDLRSSSYLASKVFDALLEAVVALWEVVYEIERGEMISHDMNGDDVGYWGRAYRKQKELVTVVLRGFSIAGWPHWWLPVMYEGCRFLKEFAIQADIEDRKIGRKAESLEDATRVLNRAFNLCLSDRAPLEESRKWGTYYIVNLLFKTYFKVWQLNSISLSRSVLRALQAVSSDMPPLDSFPKSHIVTFKYFVGIISFLEEEYISAETSLLDALHLTQSDMSPRNAEQILTYLIPAHLMTSHQLPSPAVFAAYPRLNALFGPIAVAIRSGNLMAFEAALADREDVFVKRRIYLTLERARDITMRNLFRRVFIIGGKKTRISVNEFRRVMGFSSAGGNGGMAKEVEAEEVECLLAGMIYKGLMKGYISREKGMVVLSGKDAFPGTGC